MTNRKYAGLLEGKSEEERLKSALAIVRPYVEDLVSKYKNKLIVNDVDRNSMHEMFDALGSAKLYKIAPDLEDKYEVITGITDENVYVEHKVRESWREKQPSLTMNMDGIRVRDWGGTFTIDGNSISAGAITTSQLSPGGVRFSVDGEYTRIDATRDLDLRIDDSVYRGITIHEPQQMIFNPEARRRIIDEINEVTLTPYRGTINTEGQGWVRRP